MTDYFWLDLETTGLDPKKCRIIEVAGFITSDDLVPTCEPWQAVIYQNPHVGWDDVALEMHQKSGLYNIMVNDGRFERDVVKSIQHWLKSQVGNRKVHLAGNSIHFDRGFIEAHWPEIMPAIHHRQLDVSSFKLFAEGRGVKKFNPSVPAHRALDDIMNSLQEFKYYLSEIKKLP